MCEIVSFDEALRLSGIYTKRNLLLGNGFSIACVPNIFTYQSLFEETDFSQYPEIKDIFESIDTTDFELVINALENTSIIVPIYDINLNKLVEKIHLHANKIKELLIKTIADRHPELPDAIPEDKYRSCRNFFSYFIREENPGRIYSLNYDLLLYWTLMHDFENEDFLLKHDDGFRKNQEEETLYSEELFWQGKTDSQNIHYIHGALHLFQGQGQLEKFSWSNTGIRLIDQARSALNDNKFPLFVSEGNSDKKLSKIMHSPYLFNGFKSFEAVSNAGKGIRPGNTCLFSYGLSFADNDEHIFKKIENGRVKHVFISIYGETDDENNKRIISICEGIKEKRTEFPLKVTYYDAESAHVWDQVY